MAEVSKGILLLFKSDRRAHGEVAATRTELAELRDDTTAIPGRPGWRVDAEGREWYSADWLSER